MTTITVSSQQQLFSMMRERGIYIHNPQKNRTNAGSCPANPRFPANIHTEDDISSSRLVASFSCVLDHANLGRPQHPPIEHEPLLLRVKANPFLLVRLRRLENRLMHIGIELLARITGVEALKTVFLQRANQNAIRHLDAIVQRDQIRIPIIGLEFIRGHGAECAVEIVDALDEIAGKALDGKVLCGLCFALGALLQVAEVGDGAEVLVLCHCVKKQSASLAQFHLRTFNSTISLSFFSISVFNFAASSFAGVAAASSFFSAVSPSLAAGASEYHRRAGVVATRAVTSGCLRGAKAAMRCLEARRIVLCSIVKYEVESKMGAWRGKS